VGLVLVDYSGPKRRQDVRASFAFAARLTARYTVERLIFSSSPISDVVYSPASYSCHHVLLPRRTELG